MISGNKPARDDMKNKEEKKTGQRPRKRTSGAAPAKSGRTRGRTESPSEALILARQIVGMLEEKQGIDPVIVDVRGQSSVTDCFIVVSGHNIPHIRAMADEIQVRLKKTGVQCYRKAERAESGWLVLDYVNVVTHILLEESRKYYAIEDLWAEHPRPG